LITRSTIAGTIAVSAAALVAVLAVPASASTGATAATRTTTIGSCTATGEHASCALNVQANQPLLMHAKATATPNQVIKGQFGFSCHRGSMGVGIVGAFDSRGPFKQKLVPTIANPTSCSLNIQGRLPSSHGGKLQFTITATFKK
jgi:hypothetical protein